MILMLRAVPFFARVCVCVCVCVRAVVRFYVISGYAHFRHFCVRLLLVFVSVCVRMHGGVCVMHLALFCLFVILDGVRV